MVESLIEGVGPVRIQNLGNFLETSRYSKEIGCLDEKLPAKKIGWPVRVIK